MKYRLPKEAETRIGLVDKLIALERARDNLRAEDAAMQSVLPFHWRGEKTDVAMLVSAVSAVQTLFSLTPHSALLASSLLASPLLGVAVTGGASWHLPCHRAVRCREQLCGDQNDL